MSTKPEMPTLALLILLLAASACGGSPTLDMEAAIQASLAAELEAARPTATATPTPDVAATMQTAAEATRMAQPVATAMATLEGGRIAFVSYRDGNAEIYVIDVKDALLSAGQGEVTRLTHQPRSDWDPAWSPDAQHIAFTSNRYDSIQEIYVIPADGGEATRLTNHPAGNDSLPAWSPDGTRIAFTSYRDGNADIYVMPLDWPSPARPGSATRARVPHRQVQAGQAAPGGYTDEGELIRLTDDPAQDISPAWSPDGKYIAFTCIADTDGSGSINVQDAGEIYVMPLDWPSGQAVPGVHADGGEGTNLTDHPAHDVSPVWSPDGKSIAFQSDRDGNPEIYIVPALEGYADGGELIRLTNHPAFDEGPTWSPDGAFIAFESNRDGNWEIYIVLAPGVQANGSGLVNLTNNPANDRDPAWAP